MNGNDIIRAGGRYFAIGLFAVGLQAVVANPVIEGTFADPYVLYAEGMERYYLYPTQDMPGWGAYDLKVYSSADLKTWRREGIAFDLRKDCPWSDANLWAPTVLERREKDGTYRYYLYYTAKGGIGVAVASNPAGPFKEALGRPLVPGGRFKGMAAGQNIDPDVFRDPKSGKTYLYYGNSFLICAELGEDLKSLVSSKVLVRDTECGRFHYSEGPHVFFRNGLYYFTWSENDTRSPDYRVRYLISDSPTAFVRNGKPASVEPTYVLSKDVAKGVLGTGHHSVVRCSGTNDAWRIFYHRLPPGEFEKLGWRAGYYRQTCMDTLEFLPDGRIKPVRVTTATTKPVDEVEKSWGVRDYRLDLGDRRHTTENWSWNGWNGLYCSLTNGALAVTGGWFLRHGQLDLYSGATLKFVAEKEDRPAATFVPGAGDSAPRRTTIHPGAVLDLNGARFAPFNASFDVHAGGTLRLSPKYASYGWKGECPVSVSGRLEMPQGFVLTGGETGAFVFKLEEGSETSVGGDVSNGGYGTRLDVVVRGGTMKVTGDSAWEITSGFVGTNVVWEVDVAEGAICDLSSFTLAPGAKIVNVGRGTLVRSHDDPMWKANAMRLRLARIDFHVEGDSANRCYFIEWPLRFTNVVRKVTYHCPDDDVVETHLAYFHRRYPDNGGRPFVVKAVVTAVDGTEIERKIRVRFNPRPIGKPAPNEKIFIGAVCYGSGRERFEMTTNDLGNLYVRWGSWPQLLPDKAGEDWMREAERKGIAAMTIYESGCPAEEREKIKKAWGRRYFGNSVGERTGFLYGSRREMRGPQLHGQTLSASREWFVSKFVRDFSRGERNGIGRAPFHFATSGAAFSSYELEGGVDFVCSELYAVGCGNLTYAQSEARGAARRWGPEWFCGWLAHEWQTFGIPYESDDKYLSLEAGMKSLYLIGTSLMCLESGSSGTQAHPYTCGGAKDPDGRKHAYAYDEEPCRRYRETLGKVYRWVKANPRDKGTPETRIALALGGGDGYIGCASKDIAPWGQHTNRIDHIGEALNVWAGSVPEENWAMTRGVFFPECGTVGVSGTPYGQTDVIVVDDQSRPRDLARYSLIVFGGWNTMTARARDVLVGWVSRGGTLALAKPQLTTRDDRDFVNYTDGDLMPLWEGAGREIAPGIEMKRLGKGEVYLSTAHCFPVADKTLKAEWEKLLHKLAARVPQRLVIAPVGEETDETRFFATAVYETKAYLLNLDMHQARTVRVTCGETKGEKLTLKPLEVRVLDVK